MVESRYQNKKKGGYFMKESCKRIFAIFFAVVLILSNGLTTFAFSPGGTGEAGSGSGGIEGFISKDVFKVTLPTIPDQNVESGKPYFSTYDFILDPLGLTPEKDPDKKYKPNATLFFGNTGDDVPYDYSDTSDALTIKSQSTMDVDVELEAELSGMGDIQLTNDRQFSNNRSACVYLALADSRGKTASIDKYGAYFQTVLKGSPNAYKVEYTSESGYDYVLKNDSQLEAENIKFPEYIFRLTGACNTKNSWSNLGNPDPTIKVTWTISPRGANVAPSIGKTRYTMEKDRPVFAEVDLGSGNLAAKGIKEIKYENSEGETVTLQRTNYTLTNGTLTIKDSYISAVIAVGALSRNYEITFDDHAETKETITLIADNVSKPSVDQKEYTLVSGKDVLISVDLGSGESGATGITSITYQNSEGKDSTLSSDQYTFENGILKIRGSYIKAVIETGATRREYTITFNNKEQTQKTVVFLVDGTAPSISQNSYTMQKGKDIKMNVDLGSGYLEAHSISSIVYDVNPGDTRTLAAENYSFSNGILTMHGAYITDVIDYGVKSRDYTIIFDNVSKTKATITLTAQDISPSIQQTDYTMESGKDILINVDLGSGESGATGITSITYQNSEGKDSTLSSDQYTFENGILKIRGSYIKAVIETGATRREYTITFNNKEQTQKTVVFLVDGTAPSISQNSYTMQKGKDIKMNVDLGSGYLEAHSISSIVYDVNPGDTRTLAAENYSFSNGILTMHGAYITDVIDYGVKSRDYTIIFDNVSKTKATITLTAQDISPSIQQTEYTMKSGNDVLINVDLGSGNSRATGIQSIEYINSDNNKVSLSNSNYSFANDVLTIKGAYISAVLEVGVLSRDYTIKFDDPGRTEKTIKFKANGTFPSIAKSSYPMHRGTDIQMTVDLGTGDLKATSIRSITYVDDRGQNRTLSSEYYSFSSNGILTIKGEYITAVINTGTTSRDYTILFDNVAKTKVKVALTAENKGPSVAQTSYKMVRDQDLSINLDLGSGNLTATGIRGITYVDDRNTARTLSSTNYVLSNGKITIRGTYITAVLNTGTSSRNYTITFNDGRSTRSTIQLVK